MADYLQLSFNAGELDPDEHERADVEIYANGSARQENLRNLPHGGLDRRAGFRRYGRGRCALSSLPLTASMVSLSHGGTAADLIDPDLLFTTSGTLVADTLNVIASIDLGAAQSVSAVSLTDMFIGDPANSDGGSDGVTDPIVPPDFDEDYWDEYGYRGAF